MTQANAGEFDRGTEAKATPRAHARAKRRKPAKPRVKLPVDPTLQCSATAKKTGQRCRARAVMGRNVCQLHGGAGGGQAKHGKESALPERVHERYLAARASPSLLSLKDRIAMMDALVFVLQERYAEKDTPAFREAARGKARELEGALGTDLEKAQRLAKQLVEFCERGGEEDSALGRLLEWIERVQKRVEENRRLSLQAQQVINVRDLHTAFVRMVDALATGLQAEKIADEVAGRLLDRMQSTLGELGFLDPIGARQVASVAARN